MAVMSIHQPQQSYHDNGQQETTVSRTWHEAELARRIELKYLIRRFEIQLRYGCTAKNCKATHCLTGRKHAYLGPARRPSPLTARMMAFHLAAGTDPYSKLCSKQPSVLPQHLDLSQNVLDQSSGQPKALIPVELAQYLVDEARPAEEEGLERRLYTAFNSRTIKDYWQQNLRLTPGSQPDRKSLMQNLFATKAVRSFLWTSLSPKIELPILRTVLGLSPISTITSIELTEKSSTPHHLPEIPESVRNIVPDSQAYSFLSVERMMRLKTSYIQAFKKNSTVEIAQIELTLRSALGTAEGLLGSFRDPDDSDVTMLMKAFDWRSCQNDTLLLNCLYRAVDAVFIPPAEWTSTLKKQPHPESSEYLDDDDVIHIFHICWFALIGWIWPRDDNEIQPVVDIVAGGCMYEDRNISSEYARSTEWQEVESRLDSFDGLSAVVARALAAKLVHAMGVRTAFVEARRQPNKSNPGMTFRHRDVYRSLMNAARVSIGRNAQDVANFFEAWMLNVINCNWKGELIVSRWDAIGSALDSFSIDSMSVRLAQTNKLHWVEARLPAYCQDDLLRFGNNYGKDPNMVYLWSVPTLFTIERQVRNFRALNYARMSSAYREGIYAEQLSERLHPAPQPQFQQFLHRKLETATSRYLVLNVRRGHLLEDALDQLWGRERRELLRPLKVRMGMDLGEAGVDQGGVSQEFFRLVYRKAFDPEFGLFTKTDEKSTYIWPRTSTQEPLVTYQLLGLLTALGLYNGFTLPVHFPPLFYMLLCKGSFSYVTSHTVEQDFFQMDALRDIWPSLCANLTKIQIYSRDKLEEDLALDWTYTYVSDGEIKHVDMFAAMNAEPGAPRRAAVAADPRGSTPVTGSNVDSYIIEYIRWSIKETVYDQLEAFAHGFKAVIDDAALSMLTPQTLQKLTEGEQRIDIDELQDVTKLEGGYTWDDPIITWFWEIVEEDYSVEEHKALLNFVTAIDRVPVTGMQSIQFAIVKKGSDSELLPSSSTCFGKLLIPEYASKEKLKAKLDLALENSIGFGSA